MKTKIIETINETEVLALADSERIIQRGLSNFLEVGAALMVIREARLYRGQYATFEEYCQKRWQMGRRHACRLTDAAVVARNLCPIGHIPGSESQIRPLTTLPPEKQQEAWVDAIARHPNPTARQVRAAVHRVAPEYTHVSKPTVLEPELSREQRYCAVFECLVPELQGIKEQFNDSPAIFDILRQCLDGLWLCHEELRDKLQIAG